MKQKIADLIWHITKHCILAIPVMLIFIGVVWLLSAFDSVWFYVPIMIALMYSTGRITRYLWEAR